MLKKRHPKSDNSSVPSRTEIDQNVVSDIERLRKLCLRSNEGGGGGCGRGEPSRSGGGDAPEGSATTDAGGDGSVGGGDVKSLLPLNAKTLSVPTLLPICDEDDPCREGVGR